MSNGTRLTQTHDVTLTLLSPLHIGTGRELQRGFDYVTRSGRTWMIDADGMLDAFVDEQGRLDDRIIGRPAAELLVADDYREGSKAFRYVLEGQPRSGEAGAALREQIKDVFDQPYIPGSSIKGALRTVLLWHAWRERKTVLETDEMRTQKTAAQPFERRLFGPDPNHDLLRAIRVADSEPVRIDALRIANAQVVTGAEKMGSPIEVESLKTDTVLHTTLTLDTFLRTPQAEQQMKFGDRWRWINQLPAIARAWGLEVLEAEQAWFAERKYVQIAELYREMAGLLKGEKLGRNRFFLQIGWGGGWNVKTVGPALRADPVRLERLLDDRQLSPARIRRNTGQPFPKSRRVMVINQPAQIVAPFGWCLVEMKERK